MLYVLAGSRHWPLFSKELLLLTETEEVTAALDKNACLALQKKPKKNQSRAVFLEKHF